MAEPVVDQRDLDAIKNQSVDSDSRRAAGRSTHRDRVHALTVPILDSVLLPGFGNARLDAQLVAALRETENRLETHAIGPARRAGVPGPAAASMLSLRGIHVRGHDVRLDLVGRRALR